METSDRRSRYDRSRSISSVRDRSRSRPRALSFSRSPSPRGRRPSHRTRSLGRSVSSFSFSSSSSSRSRRRSSRSRRRAMRSDKKPEEKGGAIAAIKSAAPLLATIGVASVVAHKFWPKGVLFGDKEDWETRKVVERRAKTIEKDEDGAIRRARSVRHREGGDLVVNDVIRKTRRDHSSDGSYGRRLRRPNSAYYEGERQYGHLPPPPPHSHYTQGERVHQDERHAPRHVQRYGEPGYDDPRYSDLRYGERVYQTRGYADERGYEDRDRGRW